MQRLNVSLEDSQYDWIDAESDTRGLSKSQIIREAIKLSMGEQSLFDENTSSGDKNLEDRVEKVESRLHELTTTIENLDASATDTISESDEILGDTRDPTVRHLTEGDDSDTAISGTDTEQSDSVKKTADQQTTEESVDSLITEHPTRDESSSDDDLLTDEESRDSSMRVDSDVSEENQTSMRVKEVSPPASDDTDAIESYLTEVVDEREIAEAILICWQQLKARGTVNRTTFHEIYESHPNGYDSVDEWWEAVSEVLESLPSVSPPREGGNFYKYNYS